jgi:D-glycero-D-manno-heptose 1,7-bisphosphate phosphatase
MTAHGRLRAVRTVFLDRDGTINVPPAPDDYITSPADLVLLPGAAKAVADLNAAGLRTVLVTNQRWLSGPAGDARLYAAIHARLQYLLAAEGARLDAAYYCPHEEGVCDCRKPRPGMLRRAARDLRFELASAVMIGDCDTDVLAGTAAGAAAILLDPGDRRAGLAWRGPVAKLTEGQHAGPAAPDIVARDLPAAVGLILRESCPRAPR